MEQIRIAIPVADGKLCMHFGHCETFTILTVGSDNHIMHKEELTPPPHEPGVLPKWIAGLGVNTVIAGGMGMHAQQLFAEQGVSVITGAPPLHPQEIALSYLAGSLVTGSNTCDH